MKRTLRLLLFCGACSALTAVPADFRPHFDKSGYQGTLWTQVNPWWPPNKSRKAYCDGGPDTPHGGPNYARKVYSEKPEEYWLEAMRETQRYGMTGWQFELVPNTPTYGRTFQTVLHAATKLEGHFQLAPFITMMRPAGGCEEAWRQLQTQFDIFAREWKDHPNIARIDGRPIISIYTSLEFSTAEWQTLMKRFEERYGKAIWLMNFWWKTYDVASKPAQLREYLPYFDGITAYANWSEQKELYDTIGKIMREEFPQKIFEGSVHNTYSIHYYHGGTHSTLSEKYRKSWESMLENKPDSVVMTNLFDTWENSLVLPCYEREDFLLRYAQSQMCKLYGSDFPLMQEPELVLTNYVDVIPGPRPVRFEVIAFPLDAADRRMELTVEVASDTGQIIHVFPKRTILLDRTQTMVFELPSEVQYINHRALIPRISGTWRGRPWHGDWNPPTILDTSMRTSWMYWARSSRNRIPMARDTGWSLNGHPAGSTVDWHEGNGLGLFRSTGTARLPDAGVHLRRILRNTTEWQCARAKDLQLNRSFMLPYPGEALNFYWMEIETVGGNRFQTLPIWVHAGKRQEEVSLPVCLSSGKIIQMPVKAVRVPVFNYPCDLDSGELLWDRSGYEHHGRLHRNGTVTGPFGSLGGTGFYHRHEGETATAPNPHFRQDEDGKGYLHFAPGNRDFYMISGGTAFPYAATWELECRITGPGKEDMYLLGTAYNQINLYLDTSGYLCASRDGKDSGDAESASSPSAVTVKSKRPLTGGNQWHRIAVVYDLRQLTLYLDGKLQQAEKVAPDPKHEMFDHLTVASKCNFLNTPGNYFSGDLRRLRFSGRNLSPEELNRRNSE